MSYTYQAINVQPSIAQGFYSDTLYKATSIEMGVVTVYSNIKNSEKITSLNTASGLQAYSCDWSPSGNINMDALTLDTCKLKINKQMCKDELEQTYFSQLMKPGVRAELPSNVLQFWVNRTLDQASIDIEKIIWAGDTTSLDPILKLCNGFIKRFADATASLRAVVETTINPLTAANLVTELLKAYADIPDQLDTTGMFINMPIGTKKFFNMAVNSTVTQVNSLGISISGENYSFYNIPINFSAGMPTDNIVIANPINLAFGTDLVSDVKNIVVDKVEKFGDNYGLEAMMRVGVQFLNNSEIVWAHV